MNEYDLFDAIGGVEDDLLHRSEQTAAIKIPFRKLLITAAAVMLLAVTAIAAPAVRNWFSAQGSELFREGVVLEPDENGLGGGYAAASYDVTLVLEDAEDAPQLIEDLRIPTYFIDNGWTVTVSSLDKSGIGTACFFFQPADDQSVGVLFKQDTFNASSPWDPVREQWYCVPGTLDGELIEQPITIGEWDATLYITPPWYEETVGSDPGQKAVIWSDGEYAYCMEFDYDMELSFIEEVILSLDSVDMNDYEQTPEDPQPMKPIETFYSLGMVPEGFEFEERSWQVNNAWETYYLDFEHFIILHQCVIASEENYGPYMDIEGELQSMKLDQRDFTAEEYQVDDVQVTVIRETNAGPDLMWYLDEYCFCLSFSYDPGLTDAELLDYYRSVQPMEDFTDHLTD